MVDFGPVGVLARPHPCNCASMRFAPAQFGFLNSRLSTEPGTGIGAESLSRTLGNAGVAC